MLPQGLQFRNLRRAPTGLGIKKYCAKNRLTVKPVTLDASSTEYGPGPDVHPPTLHFVTPRNASSDGPTLLYFHGGGYVNPMRAEAHAPFVLSCAAACKAKEVVFLEYALAPEHPYPAQLIQAVAALRYLLMTHSLKPENIIVGGDSAGGNLVGSLLAHLVKPSPYAAPLDLNGGQLRAALFVSPWVMMDTNQKSFNTNDGKDYIDRPSALAFKADWSPNEAEVWANLCRADDASEIWSQVFGRGSPGVVKNAMVTVGTVEVLLDSCRAFADDHVQAKTVVGGRECDWSGVDGVPFVYAECTGEAHVQPALDGAVGYEGGAMMAAIRRWLTSV